ncbi:beta strand repeat-containing protein [Aquisphaera insulae]|uniref:beta strand repeat-containing protein n=1 Tax=Aquisphaera insulae TaxID=2712864 RepID=UPI0013EBBAFF|nr:Ig-like domain-containing protein [Aquisphaera insulae]
MTNRFAFRGVGRRAPSAARAFSEDRRRRRRPLRFEPLEDRTLMAYSISATSISVGPFLFLSGTATGDNAGDDSIAIKAIGGNVAYSLDGGQSYSTSWAGVTIPVGNDTLIFSSISITAGDSGQSTPGISHSVSIDTSNGALQATKFNIQNASQAEDTSSLDIDDAGTTTPGIYNLDGALITGIGINVTLSGVPFSQGITLHGGNAGSANTFNINPSSSTPGLAGQPIKLVGGPAADDFEVTYVPGPSNGIDATLTLDGNGGADVANLGTGGNALAAINSPVLLRNSSPTGSVALTFDDSGDSTARSYVLTSAGIGLVGDPSKADFSGQALASIALKEGGGGNTTTVSSSPSNASIQGGLPITIQTGAGVDSTIVTGTGADSAVAIRGQGGADSVTIGQGDTSSILGAIDVSNSGGSIALIVDDSAGTAARVVGLGATSLTGLTGGGLTFADLGSLAVSEGIGGNTTTVTGVPAGIGTTLNTGPGADDTTVKAVGSTSTLAIDGRGGLDSVTLTDGGLVAGIAGGVTVANTGGSTGLMIDDSADTTPRSNVLISSVTVGMQDLIRVSGLPSADLDAVAADLASLAVKLGPTTGNVGNSVTYDVTTGSFAANLFTGPQDDDVQVKATAPCSQVTIDGQGGSNTASLGTDGDLSSLHGTITLRNFAAQVVDDGADPTDRNYLLSVVQEEAILSGLPNGTTLNLEMAGSLQLIAGAGDDLLTVDFAGGNPIPAGGVNFDGGAGDNTLSLQGWSVDGEVYTPSASQPGSGRIALTTEGVTSTVTFSGLKPINDTVAAMNYVADLTLLAGPQDVDITSVGGATRISSADTPSAFEMVDVSNKQNITVNTGPGADSIDLNLATADAALQTLTVDTDGGSDRVDVVATPAGVGTFVNTRAADDAVYVLGAGLGGTLAIDGGTGGNTLDVDAAGSAITPPTGSPLTIQGHAVTYTNFRSVMVADAVPASPTIAFQNTGLSLAATQGVSFANLVVARFTATTPGVPTSAYVAALILWGDGTSSAGLVVPSSTSTTGGVTTTTYDVLGSHAYATAGTSFTISTTLTTTPEDFAATTGGVKVITSLAGETAGPATIPATVSPAGGGSVTSVTAALDPASDSGQSNSDYITRVVQPQFYGLTQPGVTVQLFARAAGGPGLGTLIGTTASDAAGAWSLTSNVALSTGTYTITAVATAANLTTASAELPKPLVVDTISPVITGVVVNRIGRTIQVTFVDALSGLDQLSLADGHSYVLTGRDIPRHRPLPPGSLVSTVLAIAPASTTTSPQTVTLSFGKGQKFLAASYLFQVLSGGIRDVAGNGLAGTYYGSYPTGNGRPGDYAAAFSIGHGKVSPLRPVVSYVAPSRGLAAGAAGALAGPQARVAASPLVGRMTTAYRLLARKLSLGTR